MTYHNTLMPDQPAPELNLELVGGSSWSLSDQTPENFVMIDFYRGLHCPRCKLHIIDINNKIARFRDRGVTVLAVSMNDRDEAEKAVNDWGLSNIDVGYGLTREQAQEWGLYISQNINEREPTLFCEPATLFLRPRGSSVYAATYGTNPFNRIHAADILEGLDAILARDYPARGNIQ